MDDAAFAQYWAARQRCGLGVQPKKGPVRWLYQPTPRQVQFHEAPAPNVLYGGAYGGAKTKALRWDFHMRGMRVRDLRGILFRRTLTELKDNHIDEARKEAELLGATFIEGDKTLRYPTGSWLRFAHCENPGDEEKYLSSEYEWIGIDELATFTKTQALAIMSRARTSREGLTSSSGPARIRPARIRSGASITSSTIRSIPTMTRSTTPPTICSSARNSTTTRG